MTRPKFGNGEPYLPYFDPPSLESQPPAHPKSSESTVELTGLTMDGQVANAINEVVGRRCSCGDILSLGGCTACSRARDSLIKKINSIYQGTVPTITRWEAVKELPAWSWQEFSE